MRKSDAALASAVVLGSEFSALASQSEHSGPSFVIRRKGSENLKFWGEIPEFPRAVEALSIGSKLRTPFFLRGISPAAKTSLRSPRKSLPPAPSAGLDFSTVKLFPLRMGLAFLGSLLSCTTLLAQGTQLLAPPVLASPLAPPPEPDPLLQPALPWESLAPKGDPADVAPTELAVAPPPEVEAEIAPAPVPLVEEPLPGPPNPSDKELVEPDVEVWRQDSESPQSPARYHDQLKTAYMTGTEPVTLKVQFDARAAGRSVFVRPGRGISVEPANTALFISSEGVCVLTARLAEGVSRSHILFYCDGIRTVLPISRASALQVGTAEEGGEVEAPVAAATPPPDENPEGNTGALKPQIQTGGSYDAHSGNATRMVNDLHVPGALGDYGLDFTRYWNSVPNDNDNSSAVWPTDFGTSGWSHSWGWYAGEEDTSDNPGGDGTEEIFTTAVTITFPDGHATRYKITRSNRSHGGSWIDPRCGPPYLPEHGETNWPPPGAGVADVLGDMAYDGSEFWLRLADGGSVHFIGGPGVYQASELFDPHGFRTGFHYTGGLLDRVEQEGGRWLTIIWGTIPNWAAPVIAKVTTGGPAGWQRVVYTYQWFPASDPRFVVLAGATYDNEPALGQSVAAHYIYGSCYGDGEPCNGAQSLFPLLKTADDPHFDGPMTKIRYSYRGVQCPEHPPGGPWGGSYPGAYLDFFSTAAEAIHEERNGVTGQVVSAFGQGCRGGGSETNGFGGWRALYYGKSHPPHTDECRGYQLARITDFTYQYPLPASLPYRQQSYLAGIPHDVWDARRNHTLMLSTDTSGMASEVHHNDGSARFYDRVNPGNSAPSVDATRIHNPFAHWLFGKTDENGNKTTYTRDSRRRITHISVTNASGQVVSAEDFAYNGLNQVTSHTMPSGAVQTYEYDGNNRLVAEYDSVDPVGNRKEYTYDALERVATMKEGRAIRDNAPYTVRLEYNGRHQVTKVHYRSVTGGNSDPTVTYEYDDYGNCTAMADELGHRTVYRYDDYRRCVEMIEPVNACGQTNRIWNWFYDRWIEESSPGYGLFGASSHTSKEWRVQVEPAFNAAGDRRVTARSHDINNRLKVETTGLVLSGNAYSSTLDTETHFFAYDANGMKNRTTDPRGRVTDYTYDVRNRLSLTIEPKRTDQISRPTTQIFYDYIGNKTKVKFPDLTIQRWDSYDAFGQPAQFIDERNNPTDMTYQWGSMKKLHNVTTYRLKDDGNTEAQPTTFDYDGMGRPLRTVFPDATTEVNTYEFGQPKTWKTRRGQTKTITYDARGREQSHSWNDGMTPGVARTWDDANRLTGLSNMFSTLDYVYDDAGQRIREGSRITGSSGSAPFTRDDVSYCRYASGEVSDVTYPSGLAVHRNYTARGQLQSESWAGGSVNYAYLADGKVEYEDYGNGVRSGVDYDGRGFVSLTNTYRRSTEQIYSKRDYWRDDRDRITAWKKAETGRGDRYGYDAEGQLTSAVYNAATPEGTPTGAARTDAFTYDALGNRAGWNWLASRGQMWLQRRDNGLNEYQGWSDALANTDPQHWGSAIDCLGDEQVGVIDA